MNTPDRSSSSTPAFAQTLKAVLLGGFLAGALDLIFALTYYSLKDGKVLKVLQSIAAGVQGKTAFQGGAGSAALGVALHFGIAIGAATAFSGAAKAAPVLLRRPLISGAVFGAGVYYFMNLVVLPLSALQAKGFPLKWEPWVLGAHVFLVGMPIAWVAAKARRV